MGKNWNSSANNGSNCYQKNLVTGLIFLCFFVTAFCLVRILRKSVEIATKALPKDLDPNTKDTIQNCIGATLTIGAFAIAGIIIRGENVASRFVHEQIPIGMSIGIIDPIFAGICIGVIWIYTILLVFE